MVRDGAPQSDSTHGAARNGAGARYLQAMRCHNCQAPRLPASKACPYCGATFTMANPPAAHPGAAAPQLHAAWDLGFVRMRRQPRTEGLLGERVGLAEPPRPGALRAAAPLVLLGGLGAALLVTQRNDDGTFDQPTLWVACLFLAFGAAATFNAFRRAARIAKTPVEGLLVRVGVRDVTTEEPGVGAERRAHQGRGKPRWVLALEDGSQRFVWPLADARGKDKLTRGVGGVAWVKGHHLVGFEPIE